MAPGSPDLAGCSLCVSIVVRGGDSQVERVLSEVVRVLTASVDAGGARTADTPPTPARDEAPAAERPGRRLALADLTNREVDVLDLVARGYDNATIAEHLGISPRTVRNHLNSVFSKLGVAYRPQAVVLAREAGLGRV